MENINYNKFEIQNSKKESETKKEAEEERFSEKDFETFKNFLDINKEVGFGLEGEKIATQYGKEEVEKQKIKKFFQEISKTGTLLTKESLSELPENIQTMLKEFINKTERAIQDTIEELKREIDEIQKEPKPETIERLKYLQDALEAIQSGKEIPFSREKSEEYLERIREIEKLLELEPRLFFLSKDRDPGWWPEIGYAIPICFSEKFDSLRVAIHEIRHRLQLEKNVSLIGEEEIKESSQLLEKLPQLLEIVKEMKEIKEESHNPREIDADLVAKIGEKLLSKKRFSEFKDLMLDSKVPDEF